MEWINVKDRLPEAKKPVLAYSSGAARVYLCWLPDEDEYIEHWHICEDVSCACCAPTAPISHWLEFPELPKLSPTIEAFEDTLKELINGMD